MTVVIGILGAIIVLRIGWIWGYLACCHDVANDTHYRR